MTSDEMDDLVGRIAHTLRHEDGHFDEITAEQHQTHHAWIELEMQEKITRIQRNEEVRRHVLKWGIVGVLGTAATAVWHYVTGNHGG